MGQWTSHTATITVIGTTRFVFCMYQTCGAALCLWSMANLSLCDIHLFLYIWHYSHNLSTLLETVKSALCNIRRVLQCCTMCSTAWSTNISNHSVPCYLLTFIIHNILVDMQYMYICTGIPIRAGWVLPLPMAVSKSSLVNIYTVTSSRRKRAF